MNNDEANIIVVKNEGIIITAKSVAMAFHRFYYLNQALNLQMSMLRSNSGVNFDVINDKEVQRLAKEFEKNEEYYAQSHFDARAKYVLNKDEALREAFNNLE